MIDISIVVPVYNAEKNLEECLDALCCQTHKDIEIIIVNDGSLDRSQSIIDQYVIKDKRIISLYQENSGPGEARNLGISKAQGEYIGFVDSDDISQCDMYETMYILAKKSECDIVSCNYANVFENGYQSKPMYKIDKEEVNLEKYGLSEFIKSDVIGYRFGSEVWSKIFRRNLIINNKINFKSHKELLGEDILFLLECLFDAKSIVYINKPLYLHRFRMGSLTNSPKPKMLERLLFLIETYNIMASLKGRETEISKVIPYIIYAFIGEAMENEKSFEGKRELITYAYKNNLVIKSMMYIYASEDASVIKKIIAYTIFKRHLNIFVFFRNLVELVSKVKEKIFKINEVLYTFVEYGNIAK